MNMRNERFYSNLNKRHKTSQIFFRAFRVSTIIGIIALSALIYNIIDSAFGYAVIENKVPPELFEIDGIGLDELNKTSLITILQEHISEGLFKRFDHDESFKFRTRENVLELIYERVIAPEVVGQWGFWDSLFNRKEIIEEAAVSHPNAKLEFRSWISLDFVKKPQSADATRAGVRTAIFGSLWTIGIALVSAFPIGVGAAIYLEEYAKTEGLINRLIKTNIYNLAGVPSIIYGLLGLAIFARTLVQITSGAAFGYTDQTTANGRTVLTAGLTLGLLVMPMMIINSIEAIKAVPNSIRLASYALGATRWQTIWSHILPSALPGILTGTILSVSRAIGETAPLVVVGASHYITVDPTNPFSKFTTLPIQIYQWTTRPQDVFRNLAAAAILVLLAVLLTLNATAVLLRNKTRQ